ncbi:MAG: ribokinase, partial [Acidobacteria bacterium]|nr:ribokinase [Acidobacteriota bacterium]
VVVGSINLDLVASSRRIPLPGETVSGNTFNTFPGGKGANQAVAAGRLGARVNMIGRLGNDTFGTQLRASLEAAGVDTKAVEVVPTSSGTALITTAEDGQNAIVVVPGANGELSPRELEKHLTLIREAGIILAQLEIPLETIELLAIIARRENIPLVLDPAPARALPASLLSGVHWLTPNETETMTLLQRNAAELRHDDVEAAAQQLLEQGCRNVLLKLGERGCYVALGNGERTLVPAYRVKAIDTTAAGDAFNGAFAAALLRGSDPVASAKYAAAVAAISVTRHGAQPSMPTAAEVEVFVRGAKKTA